jgi:hypothetical protein
VKLTFGAMDPAGQSPLGATSGETRSRPETADGRWQLPGMSLTRRTGLLAELGCAVPRDRGPALVRATRCGVSVPAGRHPLRKDVRSSFASPWRDRSSESTCFAILPLSAGSRHRDAPARHMGLFEAARQAVDRHGHATWSPPGAWRGVREGRQCVR